uniref:Uncharacterized protein n=1 Tax=Rhizophora mucronata TaxID=61149 RepID=A0A2P2K451_RHIMU
MPGRAYRQSKLTAEKCLPLLTEKSGD